MLIDILTPTAFRDISSFTENVLRAQIVQVVLTVLYMLTIILYTGFGWDRVNFFLVADMGLCFGFVMETALMVC